MIKNAYTDAPELHPNLILGSLHLLWWLCVHPSAWSNYIARIDPTLPPNFTLVELGRAGWQSPSVRRLLLQTYLVLPVLVGLPVGLTLWLQSDQFEFTPLPVVYVISLTLTLALMIGAVISVAVGIIGSVTMGIAAGLVASLVEDDRILVPMAIGIATGMMGSIIGHLIGHKASYAQTEPIAIHSQTRIDTPQIRQNGLKGGATKQTQIGGIIIGVLIGVIATEGVRFSLTTLASLTVGLPEESGYWLARVVVVGVSFGVATGWRWGIGTGLGGGLAVGAVYGLAAIGVNSNLNSPIIGGLVTGLLFGTSFGVTVVLPYVLAEKIAGAWAGAWAGALGSWGRHVIRNELPLWPTFPLGLLGIIAGFTWTWWRPVLFYPILAAWNLLLYRLDGQRTGQRLSWLPWHSAFWDEFQPLPLFGLDDHLLLVIERHPAEGQAALAYLSHSRQRWAAQAVQIELEARRLEATKDITGLGQAHRTLIPGELTGPASALLRQFSHLSQDIAAALNQATAYHQRLALKAIDDRLNTLIRELTVSSEPYATRFYPIAVNWQQLISQHLNYLAEMVERSQELDNPYVVGVPLTEQQEIFVGRTDIVARIEQLLPDRRRPALLLYGQRRMGKTSLLRNLGRLLPRAVVPLFVDGQRIALASDYPDFLYNLAGEMGRSAQKQRGLQLPALSRENLALHPFTGFNEWLDQVEEALQTQVYQVALLALDEFEVLNSVLHKGRFDETDVLSLLRHIIQHRPQFKVMLAGSHPLEEFQNWASYLINVQVVKIEYLALAEARQLIELPVKDFVLRYEPEATRRILEITRGHPALIQLLCYEIVLLKNEQDITARRLVNLGDVAAAVPKALASGSFFFGDIQQNQIDQTGLALLRFMAGCGEGAIVSRDKLDSLALPNLDQSLALLLQRDLLEVVNEGYRFQVELIRRWFEQA